ncbi:MAG: LTA synthase family protein [Clostridia bacterium]|nr:LTA synthase family protein [Clostridia bacterium]
MKKKIRNVIITLFIFVASLFLVGSNYFLNNYADESFDQILYYAMNGVSGTSKNVIKDIIFSNIIPLIIVFIVLSYVILNNCRYKLVLKLKIRSRKISKQIYPIKHKVLCTILIFIVSFGIAIKVFKVDRYLINITQETNLYEKYYVGADSSYITFPENKRNLIFISLESMETTMCSEANGGGWKYSIIPELEELLLDEKNISFSNTDKLGGALQQIDTHFTSAALVAQTAGIPLKTNAVTDDAVTGRYNGNGRYLENAYTLGDVLKEQGYNLEIMMGSNGSFGGRKEYFRTNGDYKVFDLGYAIETGKMTESEVVWWGFEDDRLYKWAKEEILDLASQDKPFNFILQTADTHFPDGYLSSNAERKYDSQYENVYADASKKVYEFIQWLKTQDFYDNTTIVILGDHLGKQKDFYQGRIDKDYKRTVYNVIINSAINSENIKNRQYSTMDYYPTILASLGAKIEGDRLRTWN